MWIFRCKLRYPTQIHTPAKKCPRILIRPDPSRTSWSFYCETFFEVGRLLLGEKKQKHHTSDGWSQGDGGNFYAYMALNGRHEKYQGAYYI